jgi:hypothetical protein
MIDRRSPQPQSANQPSSSRPRSYSKNGLTFGKFVLTVVCQTKWHALSDDHEIELTAFVNLDLNASGIGIYPLSAKPS